MEEENVDRPRRAGAQRQQQIGGDDAAHFRPADHAQIILELRLFLLGVRRHALGREERDDERRQRQRGDDDERDRGHAGRAARIKRALREQRQQQKAHGADDAHALDPAIDARALVIGRGQRAGPGGVRKREDR